MRLAHLSYIPMPGGEWAVREPWRMGISYLLDAFGEEGARLAMDLMAGLDESSVSIVQRMCARGINSPLTSSLGRLFDGVAAILGLCRRVSFEGQAAMRLENHTAGATNYMRRAHLYEFELGNGHVSEISVRPIIRAVVEDLQKGVPVNEISTRFHLSLVQGFTELCARVREETALNRVVLSGGVFQNAIIADGLKNGLQRKGFQVYSHSAVPTNDGGICLGQAVVAASRAVDIPAALFS
jgi:hydrogenase maturation protein HypF